MRAPSLASLYVSLGAIASALACASTPSQGGGGGGFGPPIAGTYTGCARGIASEGATSGFEGSASLTISAGSDDSVTATYTDEHGVSSSFDLDAAGVELSSNATVTGYGYGLCAGSSSNGLPTLPKSYPATLAVTSATMVTTGGAAFFAATGTLSGQQGSCSLSTPETYWITCSDGPSSSPPTASSGASFPPGSYTCASANDVDQLSPVAHADQSSTGTLKVETTKTGISVTYDSDVFLTGKLAFDVTSATTAIAAAGQSLSSQCTDYSVVPPAQLVPDTFPVTAASIVVVGSTLFLSYTGSSGGASGGSGSAAVTCPAASLVGTVVCTPSS